MTFIPNTTKTWILLSFFLTIVLHAGTGQEKAIEIGSQLELFVDDYLIDNFSGDTELYLHKPEPQKVAVVTDAPWEGNTSAYYTIFQDGDLIRMYYRGAHYNNSTRESAHREVTCYAESRDGITWIKPKLGLFDWNGSKENNIVWDGIGCHNFTPFIDTNPNCPADEKYKALGRENRPGRSTKSLFAFKSPDGIHWSLMTDEPVITKGAFDSQNLAFWDSVQGKYREYHRTFEEGIRDILTAASKDFLNWPDPVLLSYPGAPKQHLYTNAIQPYFRAPHLLVGFPTRFLPDEEDRVEPILMTSRDGLSFQRWNDPVIPETAPKDRAGNRSNYMAWGIIQTPGKPEELSVYASEAYYEGPDSRLRRFTYRTDGFVSVRAGSDGGEILTKPLVLTGEKLEFNFKTISQGIVRVEVQDESGAPLPGLGLEDCLPLRGNSIEKSVRWKKGSNLGSIEGSTVRLRIVLKNADLFAFRFR